MLNIIRQTIRQYNMLTPGDGVVVGLSGGVDSVVLLTALLALRQELGLSVYAVHINHNLRGDAAKHDQDFVRGLCEGLGVPVLIFSANVKEHAAREKLGIEEAGRTLRYKYLRRGLADFNAQKIALGHHADDNAETVLFNLFRGAGLKGLCGIAPVNGEIIRPLLEVSRASIEDYARENNIKFVTDETNAASDYSRNYIRNEIMPLVRGYFGEYVTETMAKNAMWLRADEEYLSDMASKTMEDMTVEINNEILLSINNLLSQPTALQRRILRQAISHLRGDDALTDIQSKHITAILDIAQGSTGRMAHLPGVTARREYENLVLCTSAFDEKITRSACAVSRDCIHNGTPQQPGILPIHQKRATGAVAPTTEPSQPSAITAHPLSPENPVHHHPITVTLSFTPPKQEKSHNCCTRAFNYDNVSDVLELRTRRPGDRITLEGGTKKLQDYFTDTKTPRSLRDQIPLLADGSNILWVMDKHNRTNTAYRPAEGQQTCWVTVTGGKQE